MWLFKSAVLIPDAQSIPARRLIFAIDPIKHEASVSPVLFSHRQAIIVCFRLVIIMNRCLGDQVVTGGQSGYRICSDVEGAIAAGRDGLESKHNPD